MQEQINKIIQSRKRDALKLEKFSMEVESKKKDFEIKRLPQVALKNAKDKLKLQAKGDINYLKNPFSNGVLTISDRRIELNGPIIFGTAEYVTKRIHYFNNLDDSLPIFIVIDYNLVDLLCRVIEYLKQLKLVEPLFTLFPLVFAAVWLLPYNSSRSFYNYPNALILHHQPSTWGRGNIFEMREKVRSFKTGLNFIVPSHEKWG